MAEYTQFFSPGKKFQELVVDAIIAGDLAAFKRCGVSKNDIDRRLCQYRELTPVPKYSVSERYPPIRGPTMVMFAILCEQDEILQYILDCKNPDLSIRVEGQTALHMAALTKDWRCLNILIKYQYIQENIDQPVELVGVKPVEGSKTTALHIAVNNRRLANAMLLVSQFPPAVKIPEPKKPGENKAEENPEQNDQEPPTYATADVLARTDFGTPVLYLAVFNRDPDMVRVLLAAGADPTQQHAKGKTCLELAKEMRENARKAREGEKKSRRHKRDPEEVICELLEGQATQDLETLKAELCPELLPDDENFAMVSDDDEEEDDEEEDYDEEPVVVQKKPQPKAKPKAKKHKKSGQSGSLDKIMDMLQLMNRRLEALEANGAMGMRMGPQVVASAQVQSGVCCNCNRTPAAECRECHKCFCDACVTKRDIHPCH